MINKLIKLYKENKFLEIINLVDESTNIENILELKGMSAIRLNDYSHAYQIFKKLIKLNSKSQYNYHFALSAMNTNKHNEAILAYRECLTDSRFLLATRLNMAYCYLQIGESNKAELILKELLAKNQNFNNAWYMLFDYYRKSQQFDKLELALRDTEARLIDRKEWKTNKAYLLFFKSRYKKLIKHIKENELESSIAMTSLLAKTYLKIANFESAIVLYKKLLAKDKSADSYYNLAAAYSNLTSGTDLSKAISFAEVCIDLDSEFHQAFHCQSISYYKMNRLELSLSKINLALDLVENSTEYLYRKASILVKLNRKSKSLKVIKKLLEIEPKNSKALRLKGIIHLQLGKLKNAQKNLKRSIQIDDRDQRAIAYYSIANRLMQKNYKYFGIDNFVCKYVLNPIDEYRNLDEFNNNLSRDIKSHSLLRKEPHGLAARNGYLTADIFRDNTKAIKYFKKLLKQKIKEYINQLPKDSEHYLLKHKTKNYKMSAWATLVKGDGFIDKHIHEDSWISGAYYCKVPAVVANSEINQGYFEHSCMPPDIVLENNLSKQYIRPEEGKLIIFPSYLYHQTIPHITKEDRISIAFDITPNKWLN